MKTTKTAVEVKEQVEALADLGLAQLAGNLLHSYDRQRKQGRNKKQKEINRWALV